MTMNARQDGTHPTAGGVQLMPTDTYFALIRQTLSDSGQARVRVTGMSMWPLLRHMRDVVTIVPPRDVHIGDIVLFDRMNGRYALHRVVRIRGDLFNMIGDHQWHIEYDLPRDQIVGIVSRIDRGGRRIACDRPIPRVCARLIAWLAWPRVRLMQAISGIAGRLRDAHPGTRRQR